MTGRSWWLLFGNEDLDLLFRMSTVAILMLRASELWFSVENSVKFAAAI